MDQKICILSLSVALASVYQNLIFTIIFLQMPFPSHGLFAKFAKIKPWKYQEQPHYWDVGYWSTMTLGGPTFLLFGMEVSSCWSCDFRFCFNFTLAKMGTWAKCKCGLYTWTHDSGNIVWGGRVAVNQATLEAPVATTIRPIHKIAHIGVYVTHILSLYHLTDVTYTTQNRSRKGTTECMQHLRKTHKRHYSTDCLL